MQVKLQSYILLKIYFIKKIFLSVRLIHLKMTTITKLQSEEEFEKFLNANQK